MLLRPFFNASLVCLLLGSAAHAEEGFYAGIGVGVSDATSVSWTIISTAKDRFALAGLTAGYRWETPNAFFGVELDGDVSTGSDMVGRGIRPCSDSAFGPYYCTHEATLRVRGIVGTDISPQYEAFASLGGVLVRGQVASSPRTTVGNTNIGVTAGIGVQRSLADGKLRVELVHDYTDRSLTDPANAWHYQATTLKVSYLMSF